jgi:ATP-binding cassette subfamily G (WHITE) protein 2 (SNQ2)
MDVSALYVHVHANLLRCVIGILYLHTHILQKACWVKVQWSSIPYVRTSAYSSFSALAHFPVVCSSVEFVTLIPPSGQTCGAFLQNYINRSGGFVQDPSATSSCQFCSFATSDQFLARNFHMFYSHRWRNVGFLAGYICVNVRLMSILVNVHFELIFNRSRLSLS